MLTITDECCCEYTDHGHCGIINNRTGRLDVDNDATLKSSSSSASCTPAGADLIAPSGMMMAWCGPSAVV